MCILSDFFLESFTHGTNLFSCHCFYFGIKYLYLSILRNVNVLSLNVFSLFSLNSYYKMNLMNLSSKFLVFFSPVYKKYFHLLYYLLGISLNLYSKMYTKFLIWQYFNLYMFILFVCCSLLNSFCR